MAGRGTFNWVPVNNGEIPEGAVHIGIDKDRTVLFAGRANHAGDLLPAKVAIDGGKYIAYVSWEGMEYKKDVYEVLVSDSIAWFNSQRGEIPQGAVVIGQTSTGENLYFGRTFYKGTITPGKIHPSQKCLFIPYGGEEIRVDEYEIMIRC